MENKNNRKLTAVDIAGQPYYADITRQGLVSATDPGKFLCVMDMVTLEDHHEFLFDKSQACIVKGNWRAFVDANPDQAEYVWIRRLEALDPQGMELLVSRGEARWAEHYTTGLPVIKIAGNDFYVDPVRKGFRDAENKWNIILFTDMVRDPDGGYHIFFDEKARNVPFPHQMDIYDPSPFLPAGISRIPMPDGSKLTELISSIKTVAGEQMARKNKIKKSRKVSR